MHPETLDVEQITIRLDALERRVCTLESGRAKAVPLPIDIEVRQPLPTKAADVNGETSFVFTAFPVVAAALLGIAGAYMLRALSSTEAIPRGVVAGAATLYAAGWLVAAERVRAKRFAAAVYAATSLLIIGPMLWEMTIRFQAMSGTAAAAILAGFVALYLALRTREREGVAFAIAGLSGLALLLSIGTHRMAEFTALAVAIFAATELRPASRWLRGTVAATADVAVWTLVFLYRLPPAERLDYPALPAWAVLGMAAILFAISATIVTRTALRMREQVTSLQALQAMTALVVMLCGMSWLSARPAFVCLGMALACAAAAYGPLRKAGGGNFHLFSIWAAILLAGGVLLLMPFATASTVLAVIGTGVLLLGQFSEISGLEWNGLALLIAGAFGSGMVRFGFDALAGSMPDSPGWRILLVAGCMIAVCAATREREQERRARQILHLVPAMLAAFAVAALAIRIATGYPRMTLDMSHIALLRTIMLCATSVLVAIVGRRIKRAQMARVAYLVLAFVAAKLLFEDLRLGNLAYIAESICLVALTMLAVPRLVRPGTPAR